MSEIPATPLTDLTAGLTGRLAGLRSQVAMWFWVDGLTRVLWLALALAATDLAVDWLLRLDGQQRLVMLLLMLAALGWAIRRWLVRPLAAALSDDALALQVEKSHRQLGQALISALQLSRVSDAAARGMSPALVRQAVVSGAKISQEVSFPSILDRGRFAWNLLALLAAAALLLCLAAGTLTVAPLATWFSRNILLGDRLWPQKTYLVVERVGNNGTVVFPRGDDWTQLVSVTPESEVIPPAVYLDFRHARGRGPLAMSKNGERQFEATFASVLEPFEFRARGGDAVTKWVRVELVEPPAVTELSLVVTSPAYARLPPESLPPGRGPYYVLKGSTLRLDRKSTRLNSSHLGISY